MKCSFLNKNLIIIIIEHFTAVNKHYIVRFTGNKYPKDQVSQQES